MNPHSLFVSARPWISAGALFLLTATPAAAYDVLPGSYDVNDWDVSAAQLDLLAQLIEAGSPPEMQMTNVALFWTMGYPTGDPPNIAFQFDFDGEGEFEILGLTVHVDFWGHYNSVWDEDVLTDGGCAVTVDRVWSDVTSFGFDIHNVPPWVEQWFQDHGEDEVHDMMDEQFLGVLPTLLEGVTTKDCGTAYGISGLSRKGTLVVPPRSSGAVTVYMENTGEAVWGSGTSTKLGLVGDYQSPCYPYFGTSRWPISFPVYPGDIGTYVPTASGLPAGTTVTCELQMVRDVPAPGTGAHWFGEVLVIDLVAYSKLEF